MDGSQRGERLRLRFVTHGEAHLLHGRFAPDPGGFNDFGEADATGGASSEASGGSPPAAVAAPEGELRNEHNGVLWIEPREGGEPLGTVQYHAVRYGGNAESSGWMIGIDLLPEARGQGYGAEAQRLLAAWLLDNTPANRIEAQTDVENLAEARSLERAGFTREGVLRGAQFRGGAYHDLVVYSRLRSDSR
jgi:RimJ/RimL family protein N-acetyltransferase